MNYTISKTILDEWLVKTGLLDKETAQKLKEKYKYYVPFYRNIKGARKQAARYGFADQTTGIEKAHGSGYDILDPIESIIVNVERFVKAAKRNEVMQIIDRYCDPQSPDVVEGLGYFLEKVPPDRIPQRTDMTQIKERLKKAGEELDLDNFNDVVDNIIDDTLLTFKVNQFSKDKTMVTVLVDGKRKYYQVHDMELLNALTAISPQNASWIVKAVGQLTRTMKNLTTGINPIFGLGRNVWRDIPTSYIFRRSKGYNYIGHIGDIFKAFVDVIKDSDTYKEYKNVGGGYSSSISASRNVLNETLNEIIPGRKTSSPLKAAEYVLSLIEQFNNAVETAPRLAEFKRIKETGNYKDLMQALFEAQDVSVNFTRHGKWTKEADAFIPYLNAAVQGMDKLARSNKESFGKFMIKTFISTIIPSIVLYAIHHDDEDYKQLSRYMKDNHWNIKLPDNTFWRIPKPRELGIYATGVERIMEFWKTEDPDAFYMFAEYIKMNFAPPIDRHILSPFEDIRANKNFAGNPIVPRAMEKLPAKYQYDEYTSAIAKLGGQAFNISPMKIDYIIDSYLGILGKINRAVTAEEKDPTLGFRRTVTADPLYSTDALNRFYEEKDKLDKLKEEWKITGKMPKDYNPGRHKFINTRANTLSKMRTTIKNIDKNESLSKKEKEEKIKEVRKKMNELAQDALKPKKE